MLSEEEKKAMFNLKDLENDKEHLIIEQRQSITTILNLIEKQFKEIEELKNADLTIVYLNGVYDGVKKVEDKIKAKIEEVKDGTYDAKIVLQLLLEEK